MLCADGRDESGDSKMCLHVGRPVASAAKLGSQAGYCAVGGIASACFTMTLYTEAEIRASIGIPAASSKRVSMTCSVSTLSAFV